MASVRRFLFILLLAFAAQTSGYASGGSFDAVSERLYSSFVKQDFKVWKSVIDNFHRNQNMSIDSLDYILTVQYLYVAWTISGDTIQAGAEKALSKALADLDKFESRIESLPGKSYTGELMKAKYRSYSSAFLAYQMKIAPVKVIINGWKCVNNAKAAVTDMPECCFSQIEYGNVMHSMPTVLGGSAINARKAYMKALKIMESSEDRGSTYHNWLYLHLLLCIADNYKSSEDYVKVREYYKKILTVEPSFSYVRNSLMPSLDKYEAQQKKKSKLK